MEVEGDVDTGEEGFVEGLDAVRGEEEDATIVFDVSKAGNRWVSAKVRKRGI